MILSFCLFRSRPADQRYERKALESLGKWRIALPDADFRLHYDASVSQEFLRLAKQKAVTLVYVDHKHTCPGFVAPCYLLPMDTPGTFVACCGLDKGFEKQIALIKEILNRPKRTFASVFVSRWRCNQGSRNKNDTHWHPDGCFVCKTDAYVHNRKSRSFLDLIQTLSTMGSFGYGIEEVVVDLWLQGQELTGKRRDLLKWLPRIPNRDEHHWYPSGPELCVVEGERRVEPDSIIAFPAPRRVPPTYIVDCYAFHVRETDQDRYRGGENCTKIWNPTLGTRCK